MKEVYSFRTSDQNGVVTLWIFFSGDPTLQRSVLKLIENNRNIRFFQKKKRKKKKSRHGKTHGTEDIA